MMKIALIVNLFAFTIATQSIAFVPPRAQELIDIERIRQRNEKIINCDTNIRKPCEQGCPPRGGRHETHESAINASRCYQGCLVQYNSCVTK